MRWKTAAAILGVCIGTAGMNTPCAQAQEIYYDEYGTPYFYDENGYIFYYDAAGNIYYYDQDGNIHYTTGGLEGTIPGNTYDNSIYDNEEPYEDTELTEYYGESLYSENMDDAEKEDKSAEEQIEEDDSADWHQTIRTEIRRGGGKRETPNASGQMHSYLTGKLTDAELVLQRPHAVMINNIANALPQAGLSHAAVIYEAPVEGNITRLMAVFEDVSALEKIGPVRSSRDYYIDFALEFDAFYTHFGQAVYAYDLLNSDMVDNISGLQYQDMVGELAGYAGEDIFFRTSDRPAPNNCYTSGKQLETAIERNEYDAMLDNEYNGHFKFAEDGKTVAYSDGTSVQIVPHQYNNYPVFRYDETQQKYMRFQYPDENGVDQPQIDELTGKQLSADNVIIQYCKVKLYDENGYLNINTNSGGEALLFTKGTYQKAVWEKATDWGPAKYYDAQGNEIAVNQGNTWVCIVDEAEKEDTSFR